MAPMCMEEMRFWKGEQPIQRYLPIQPDVFNTLDQCHAAFSSAINLQHIIKPVSMLLIQI